MCWKNTWIFFFFKSKISNTRRRLHFLLSEARIPNICLLKCASPWGTHGFWTWKELKSADWGVVRPHPACLFITSFSSKQWGAGASRQARLLRAARPVSGCPASVSLYFSWTLWGSAIVAVSQRFSWGPLSGTPSPLCVPNSVSGSHWASSEWPGPPFHYSVQYVSGGCLQIQGFLCQMYSQFPRLSCYNEMNNKQDILISHSVRKWYPSPLIDKLIPSNILKNPLWKHLSWIKKKKLYYKTGEICFKLLRAFFSTINSVPVFFPPSINFTLIRFFIRRWRACVWRERWGWRTMGVFGSVISSLNFVITNRTTFLICSFVWIPWLTICLVSSAF